MADNVIFYEFSRLKVERGDFSHFMRQFALERLPTGRRLREMMNCLVFTVQGYDHDDREIHSIPEVRAFYRQFHAAWPYWLYFCNLEIEALQMMMFCRLDSFITLKTDHHPTTKVEFDPLEMLSLVRADFPPMNLICERAEMFESLIEARSRDVMEYFGFEVGPTS